MHAASTSVPRAPNVFTAGPAHAAPIANAPTFSDAAVVKIWPQQLARGPALACAERRGQARDRRRPRPARSAPSATGSVAASGQVSIRQPSTASAPSMTFSGRKRVCRRTSPSAPTSGAGRERGPHVAGHAAVHAQLVGGEERKRDRQEPDSAQVDRSGRRHRAQRGRRGHDAQPVPHDRPQRAARVGGGLACVHLRDPRDQPERHDGQDRLDDQRDVRPGDAPRSSRPARARR